MVALTISFFVTLAIGEKSYDDAYITFRYARNLASGHGFVYNVGESFLGTTTPLFTLTLALLGKISSVDFIPVIAQWATGLALFALSFFTYLLGRNDGKPIAGTVSALFVFFNPIFIQVWGEESILLLALVVAAIYFYFRGFEALPAILMGLAFLTRGEGILPGFVLFAHSIATKRKVPWRAIGAVSITVAPWSIYSWLNFGSFFPSTLQSKMAQFDSGLWPPFFKTTLDMLRSYVVGSPNFPYVTPQYEYLLLCAFAFVGGISLLIRPQWRWGSILAWLALYAAGYSLIGVPFYHWYSVPLLYGGVILIGLGAQFAIDLVHHRFTIAHRSYRLAAQIVIVIAMCIPLATAIEDVYDGVTQPVSQIQHLYTKTGQWLHENTPADATVGYFEIGFMGYYAERTFIDPAGLVNPGTAEQIVHRNFKWAYLHYKPDYLAINPIRWYDRLGNISKETWFSAAYRKVAEIEEEGYSDAPISIYQKIDEGKIPVLDEFGQ